MQVPAGEEYKEKLSDQGQGLEPELQGHFSTVSARSGGESSVGTEGRSKQKAKEVRHISQSAGTTESSEGSGGGGSKQRTKEVRPIINSAGDTGSSEVESEGSACASDSGSTHPAHIMVGTAFQVRNTLRRNMLFYDESEARAPGAALITKACGILNQKRGSDWSEEKRLQVMQGIEDYRQELDATFVVNLMKHLHGDSRKVPQDKTLTNTDLEQEYNWIEAAWKKDHLRVRYNVDFLTECLPQIRTGDTYHDKLMEEVPRVENPKPDVAMGVYETALTLLQREILYNQHCNLAGPQLYGVFFAIEAKCMNASIEEAENQCLRSGCAMVSTSRRLNQAANRARRAAAPASAPPSSSAPLPTPSPSTLYPKADMNSFAFTLAVGSQYANMFVNWALETDSDQSVQWHMHWLQGYSFRKPDDLNQLHHDMNNVLDWGLSVGKDKMIDCCKRIHNSGVIQQSRKRQKIDHRDKGPES